MPRSRAGAAFGRCKSQCVSPGDNVASDRQSVCQATGERLTQDVEPDVPRTAAMQRHRGRRKIMPVLKSPPRSPRGATIQVRVEEEINPRLRKYAEFIGGLPAYFFFQSLRLLFHKEHQFRQLMAQHR